jgi:serine/threonine protein kinase
MGFGEKVMSSVAVLDALEGRVVSGRFRLEQWLGGSETTSVYATDVGGNPLRKAAIKLISVSEPEAENRLAGWMAAARLSHWNLMNVVDCGRCEFDRKRFVYEATECADEVLAEVLAERPLTADETLTTLRPVLDALEYLHQNGYVHGRLRPSNILVVEDELKLSADCMTADAVPTTLKRYEKDEYEAPETVRGCVNSAADVWALGMTLVAALTQKPARWESWSGLEPAIPTWMPRPFAEVAKNCLAVNPEERCTIKEIRSALGLAARAAGQRKKPEAIPGRLQTWINGLFLVL